MSWSLVRTPVEWQDYRVAVNVKLRFGAREPTWPETPRSFPCLVSAHCPDRSSGKILLAVVYESDARKLLLPAEAAAPAAARPALTAAAVPTQQDDFNRHVSGMLLTLVWMLGGINVFTEETFSAKLDEFMDLVDESVADRKSLVQRVRDTIEQSRA